MGEYTFGNKLVARYLGERRRILDYEESFHILHYTRSFPFAERRTHRLAVRTDEVGKLGVGHLDIHKRPPGFGRAWEIPAKANDQLRQPLRNSEEKDVLNEVDEVSSPLARHLGKLQR